MKAPVRKSLLRPVLWMGGDRRLVGISAMMLVVMGFTMFVGFGILYGLTIILPIVLWIVIISAAQQIGKADPRMFDIVMRQFKYRKFYAAKSHLGVEHPQIKDYI